MEYAQEFGPEWRLEIIRELEGRKCICGAWKRPGWYFCKPCFLSLSRESKSAVYREIGEGYEEAYEVALRELGR